MARKPPYSSYSQKDLTELATSRGALLSNSTNWTKVLLISLLKQHDLFTHPYLKYTVAELRTFIITCKIGTKSLLRTKDALVHALEQADSHFNIPFIAFPPEIRSLVYGFALTSGSRLEGPEQPALTRTSRLVRLESLPVFYTNTFSIGVEEDFDFNFDADDDNYDDVCASMGMGMDRAMGNCPVDDYALRLSMRAKSWLRTIGNLNIRDMTSVVFCDTENITFGDSGWKEVRLDIPFAKAVGASVSLGPNEQHEGMGVLETIYHISRKKEEETMAEALVVLLEENEDGRLSMGVIEEFAANLPGCGGF